MSYGFKDPFKDPSRSLGAPGRPGPPTSTTVTVHVYARGARCSGRASRVRLRGYAAHLAEGTGDVLPRAPCSSAAVWRYSAIRGAGGVWAAGGPSDHGCGTISHLLAWVENKTWRCSAVRRC
eukprot:1590515-Prymnesium_polylepis.1